MLRAGFAALVAGVVLAGCGGGEEQAEPSPATGFERALERVGTGVSGSGAGFGWADLDAISGRGPAASRAAARALGPGAEDLFDDRARLRARLGLDPLAADSATGIAASYVFGVRLDGVSGARLETALRRAGARSGRVGEWRTWDLGEQAQAPTSGPLAVLDSLAARVAVSPGAVVLARMDSAREALLGRGDSPLADPGLAFAAACLGEVEAARTLPATFTHDAVASPRLIAVGSRPAPAREEVLCAIGGSRTGAGAAEHAEALRETFAGKREPLTGEPVARIVAAAEVDVVDGNGLEAARAVLTRAPGSPEGLVFAAVVRGSVLAWVGAREPLDDA